MQHAKQTTGECRSIRQSQCLADFSVAVDVMAYQLEIKLHYLLRLCVTWQLKITAIPHSKMLPSCWGPTEAQLHDAAIYEVTADWDVGDQAGEPSDHCTIDEELRAASDKPSDDLDSELLESIEVADLTDAYCDETDTSHYLDHFHLDTTSLHHTPSPCKRLQVPLPETFL